jgi:hypothetical protein
MTWINRWSPVYLAFLGGSFLEKALELQRGLFGGPAWVLRLVFIATAISFVYLAIIALRRVAPRVG